MTLGFDLIFDAAFLNWLILFGVRNLKLSSWRGWRELDSCGGLGIKFLAFYFFMRLMEVFLTPLS